MMVDDHVAMHVFLFFFFSSSSSSYSGFFSYSISSNIQTKACYTQWPKSSPHKIMAKLNKKKFNIITILNDDDCTSVPFFVHLFDGQLKWRSEGYFFLLKKLCTCEPRSRPSFSTIVSHDRSHIRPVRLIFFGSFHLHGS